MLNTGYNRDKFGKVVRMARDMSRDKVSLKKGDEVIIFKCTSVLHMWEVMPRISLSELPNIYKNSDDYKFFVFENEIE